MIEYKEFLTKMNLTEDAYNELKNTDKFPKFEGPKRRQVNFANQYEAKEFSNGEPVLYTQDFDDHFQIYFKWLLVQNREKLLNDQKLRDTKPNERRSSEDSTRRSPITR